MARSFPFIATALAFVEEETGVSRHDLSARRRPAEVVRARTLFVVLLRDHRPEALSYPRIGRILGERHHTTILFAHRCTAVRLEQEDPEFRALCEKFDRMIEERLAA